MSDESDVLVRAILGFIYPQILANSICPPAFCFLNPSFIPNIFFDSFGFALEREYLEMDVDIRFEIYLDLEEEILDIFTIFTKNITVVPDGPSPMKKVQDAPVHRGVTRGGTRD